MSKHHTEICTFRIYALLLHDKAFLGKTAASRMSAVYSRHRTGRVASTRDCMDQEEKPTIHILESVTCTGAVAYRHILAWIQRLEEVGYCCINFEQTVESSYDLYPETEAILKALPQQPMEEILAQTRLRKPSDGDQKPSKPHLFQKPEKNVQMNLRMSKQDREQFRKYCKKHKLRARDALGLLLDQAEGNDAHLQQIQQSYEKELASLRQKKSQKAEERAVDFLAFLCPELANYLRGICPPGNPLQGIPYKRFPGYKKYEFPEEEGFFHVMVKALLWGRNRSQFIMGEAGDGKLLKFRYYQRPLYAGLRITTEGLWRIGCRKAADGAMEVAAAFPVPAIPETEQQQEQQTQNPRKASLDEIIFAAKAK